MSRIDYKKGLDLLIPSFAEVAQHDPRVRLVIAGSDYNGYEQRVRRWVEGYGVSQKAHFAGFLSGEDKLDALHGADCFVLPSMNENFGVAVVEALSAGLPVLISDNVYIWKEIIDKNGGWVCAYSKNSLTEKIEEIVNTPSEVQRKKIKANEASAQFTPQTLLPKYRKLYHGVTGKTL